MKVITTFYAILLKDRSSAPGINRNRFATMSDHACTVRKPVCRTTSAPVSTTMTLSLLQDPATRRTRANISTAIRLTSQWIRPAAITPYVQIRICVLKFFVISICHRNNIIRYPGVISARRKLGINEFSFYCGMARCDSA